MPLPLDALLLLIAGAAVAGFVQGLSGFAFSMVAMSIWVWGVDPRIAPVMAVFGGLTGQVVAAVASRRKPRLAVLAPFLVGGLLGIPLGVLLVKVVDPKLFKALIGGILVVFCPLMLLAARMPRVTFGGRLADGVVGAIGGAMGGIGGFTGVAPALWCTLRSMDKTLQREIVQNFNLVALALTFAVQLGSGTVTRDMLPLFLVIAPTMALPSLLGARVHMGLSELAARRIVLLLLTASGIAMLSASLPGLLAGR